MRFVRAAGVACFLVLVSLRYPPGLSLRGLGAPWLLLPVVCFGVTATPGRAAALGWGYGLLQDLFSLEPFGLHAFLFAGAGFLLARTRGFFFHEHPVTQAGMGFALSFLVGLALLVRLEVAEPALLFGHRLGPLFTSSLLAAALVPALLAVHARTGLFRGFGGERVPG